MSYQLVVARPLRLVGMAEQRGPSLTLGSLVLRSLSTLARRTRSGAARPRPGDVDERSAVSISEDASSIGTVRNVYHSTSCGIDGEEVSITIPPTPTR